MIVKLVIFTCLILSSGWRCSDSIQKEIRKESLVSPLKTEANSASFTYLAIRGIFSANGDSLLKIEPLQKLTTQQEIIFPVGENKFFELKVYYLNEAAKQFFFDALVASDAEGQSPVHGFFEIFIRVKARPEKIEIIHSKTNKTLYTFSKNSIPDF